MLNNSMRKILGVEISMSDLNAMRAEGMTCKEIQERTGLSSSTVYRAIHPASITKRHVMQDKDVPAATTFGDRDEEYLKQHKVVEVERV